MVFNFSFGQRRLIVNAPVHGSRAFVNEAALDEARKQPRRLGFVMVGHCDVGIFPLAKDSQPLKILRLPLQSIRRKLATRATNAERRHVFLILGSLWFDM